MPMVFCSRCGKEIHDSAISCPSCGAMQGIRPPAQFSITQERILPVFLLCFFLGVLGVHRFYVGKVGTGIVQLLTFGGAGLWALVDLIVIICGAFTDEHGNKITQWT
jgi:TM2 domain-containing membrane protein YozV